jgi:hypothetical protein
MRKSFLIGLIIVLASNAYAICPLCTVAIAGGAGFLRYFGIDDSLTGLWVGALILSSALWMNNWLEKKNVRFPFRGTVVVVLFYLLSVAPLPFMKLIGSPTNRIFGLDKMIFGIIIGTIVFAAVPFTDKYLRSINNNKVVMPYQKVIVPVTYLVISSIVIYLMLGIR